MYINNKIKRIVAASVIAGSFMFTPNIDFDEFKITSSVAHAEVKTYIGVGDYVLSDDVPPGDIKNKAKLYAERNAIEQAGIFVRSNSVVKNHKLKKDEISVIAGEILKITNVKYEIIPLNDDSGIAKYKVTITAEIDTNNLRDAINKFLNRDDQERENLVEQNKALQKIIEEQAKRIKELENNAVRIKSQEDKDNINAEIRSIDNYTVAIQKYNEGSVFLNQKNYKEAIRLYTESIQLNPKYAVVYNDRGYSYHELKQYNLAIEDFNKAIELDPQYSYPYNNRGRSYARLNNYEQAISDYNKAIQINPNSGNAYNNRGYLYDDLKEYDKAIKDYDMAIKINPNDAMYYNNRGYTYCFGLQNYNRGIEDFNKAIQLDPNFDWPYNNRGTAYIFLQNFDRAIEDFSQAIKINPNYAKAYNNRGLCYKILGRTAESEADLKKARELE